MGIMLSPIINMNPKSINVLSNNDIIRINEIAGDTLLKYGYELL